MLYTIYVMGSDLWVIDIEPEVEGWLSQLSDTDLARVDYYAGRLASEGPSMPMPRSRPLKVVPYGV